MISEEKYKKSSQYISLIEKSIQRFNDNISLMQDRFYGKFGEYDAVNKAKVAELLTKSVDELDDTTYLLICSALEQKSHHDEQMVDLQKSFKTR
jgi:hypothetical protein